MMSASNKTPPYATMQSGNESSPPYVSAGSSYNSSTWTQQLTNDSSNKAPTKRITAAAKKRLREYFTSINWPPNRSLPRGEGFREGGLGRIVAEYQLSKVQVAHQLKNYKEEKYGTKRVEPRFFVPYPLISPQMNVINKMHPAENRAVQTRHMVAGHDSDMQQMMQPAASTFYHHKPREPNSTQAKSPFLLSPANDKVQKKVGSISVTPSQLLQHPTYVTASLQNVSQKPSTLSNPHLQNSVGNNERQRDTVKREASSQLKSVTFCCKKCKKQFTYTNSQTASGDFRSHVQHCNPEEVHQRSQQAQEATASIMAKREANASSRYPSHNSAFHHRDEYPKRQSCSQNAALQHGLSASSFRADPVPDQVGSSVEPIALTAAKSVGHSRFNFNSGTNSDHRPDVVTSGPVMSRAMVKRKRAFIRHCNNDVYVRPKRSRRHGIGLVAIRDFGSDTNLIKTIQGVHETDVVLLTRCEIETEILVDEVKKLIYDMFPPTKDKYDEMEDIFTLPAKGLNHLPIHYYMNAAHPRSSNVCANNERDEMGFVTPVTTRSGRKGEEMLWSSHSSRVKSAADYDFYTASLDSAAYTVNEDDIKESAEVIASKDREIKRLREKNERLSRRLKRDWRALSTDGSDVGKYALAYFEDDKEWVDVFVKSFKRARSGRKNGVYRFQFNLKDKEGKPQQKRGNAIEELEWDDVSAGDPSVRVQDD